MSKKLNQIFDSEIKLNSGGYLVINPTEALVSIDINSGSSIKQKNVENTALDTNLEAADEIARQIKIRDLSGLIIIDFIDMQSYGNRRMVERRLKENAGQIEQEYRLVELVILVRLKCQDKDFGKVLLNGKLS